ncbi:MAG: hypothetical protein J3R72DRAFT_525570 [Linnemannia gamsii]|nr:MAG: hypothetical protein J3R72DRAFT_525570 [Linnemannia gamsii]
MIQLATTVEHVQGFRAIHKSYMPSTVTYVDLDDIIHIDCYTDPDTTFEEAQFVRNETKMLPYLKGPNYRPQTKNRLESRRIAAVPSVVLDVVYHQHQDLKKSQCQSHGALSTCTKRLCLVSTVHKLAIPSSSPPTTSLQRHCLEHLKQPSEIHILAPPATHQHSNLTRRCQQALIQSQDHVAAVTFATSDDLMTLLHRATFTDKKAHAALGDIYKTGD